MEYFNVVNLDREPFSNSPDPEFFFGSNQHLECLQKLELALRLRRGLNVVIGDVGTGKTTLCRQLIRRFSDTEEFETHLILDPDFSSSTEFLFTIIKILTGKKPVQRSRDWQLKEAIKNYLFRRGVDENKTVILIIDEGQKIPLHCLEVLREFLNYETNEHKLLQIVIFAQNEFEHTIESYANFADRINLYHYLKPMNFADTRAMIRYRIEKSSKSLKDYPFFSYAALLAIYLTSKGYPRKIINLCHRCILTMIIQNRSVVNLSLARTCSRRVFPHRNRRSKRLALSIGIPLLLFIVAWRVIDSESLKWPFNMRQSSPDSQAVVYASPNFRKIEPPVLPVVAAALPAQDSPDAFGINQPEGLQQPTNVQEQNRAPAGGVGGENEEKGQLATVDKPDPLLPPADQPRNLGTVVVMRHETLYNLIENIYGAYTSKHFKSVIMANPKIEDPDMVKIGQSIEMPAIPVDIRPPKAPSWWVSVADAKNLGEAYGYLRSLPKDAPSVRIVSYWTPQNGLQFRILLKPYFTDLESARQSLEQLPRGLFQNSRVVSIWSNDAVFYANPFAVRAGHRSDG